MQELDPHNCKLNHLPTKYEQKILRLLASNYRTFSISYKTLDNADKIEPQFKLSHNIAL